METIKLKNETHERIKSVTAPLFETLGLSFFSYKALIRNQGVVYLSTHKSWVEHLEQNKTWECSTFLQEAENLAPKIPRYYFWEEGQLPESSTYHTLCKQGVSSGITRYVRDENSIEAIQVGGKKSPQFNERFYLENMGTIERFVSYFKKEMLDITSSATVPLRDQKVWDLLDERHKPGHAFPESKTMYILSYDGRAVKLTPRETDIARCLLKGFTSKETGAYLGLSARTVESYINNIKIKTGFHFKSELVLALNKSNEG